MAESFGVIPFSVGGTNASGYSLVAAFSLHAETRYGVTYSISQENYDFGIVVSGIYDTYVMITPQFFTNITGTTQLYHCVSTTDFRSSTEITVSSSGINLSFPGSGTYDASVSIAVFKFS